MAPGSGWQMRRRKSTFRTLIKLTALGLGIAAVLQEVKKPAEEREWHGIVAGFIPYDLRPPTMAGERSRRPSGDRRDRRPRRPAALHDRGAGHTWRGVPFRRPSGRRRRR